MEVLKVIFNGMTFGQRTAEKIVGSRGRLMDLVARGLIRCERRTNTQHSKWHCNAWDCIKYAQVKYLTE